MPNKSKKILIILIGILLLIVSLGIGFHLYFKSIAEKKIDKFLKKAHLEKNTSFSSIDVGIFKRNVVLKNVKVKKVYKGVSESIIAKEVEIKNIFSQNPVVTAKEIRFEIFEEPIFKIDNIAFRISHKVTDNGFLIIKGFRLGEKEVYVFYNLLRRSGLTAIKCDEPIDFKIKTVNIPKNGKSTVSLALDFTNNLGLKAVFSIEKLNFNALQNELDKFKREVKNVENNKVIAEKLKEYFINLIKIENRAVFKKFVFELDNEGFFDRLVQTDTGKKILDKLVKYFDRLQKEAKNPDLKNVYKELKKFFLFKRRSIIVVFKNLKNLSIDELKKRLIKIKNPDDIAKYIKIEAEDKPIVF